MDVMTWLRCNWERRLGLVCLAAGVAANALAFFGVRSTPYLTEDLSYIISGGVGGLALIGLGAMLVGTGRLHVLRQDLLHVAHEARPAQVDSVVLPDLSREAVAVVDESTSASAKAL